jgi:hypothetical protein
MGLRGDLIAVGVAGAVLLAAAWYAKKKIVAAGQSLVDAGAAVLPYVNPVDSRNVAYQGANEVYRAATGDKAGTLGTGIYDATHAGGAFDGALDALSWWGVLNPGAAIGSALGGMAVKQFGPALDKRLEETNKVIAEDPFAWPI